MEDEFENNGQPEEGAFAEDLRTLYERSEIRDCGGDDAVEIPFEGEPFISSYKVQMAARSGRLAGPDSPVYVQLPDETQGVSVIVEAGARFTVALPVLGGEVRNLPSAEPDKARTINFPFDGDAPPSGCLAIYPALVGGSDGDEVDVHVLVRAGTPDESVFAVNLVVLGDTLISNDELELIADSASGIFKGNGAPEIVVDGIYREDGPSIVDDEGDELDGLRGRAWSEDPYVLNVIFLRGFLDERVLGFAGGVPGPAGVPTAASAVVLAVDSHLDGDGELDTAQLASTLAHELAHQLGLFHTSEQDGEVHDPIDDTAECTAGNDDDGSGDLSVEECVGSGGENLMFYTTGDAAQTELSDTQAEVLRAHPLAF